MTTMIYTFIISLFIFSIALSVLSIVDIIFSFLMKKRKYLVRVMALRIFIYIINYSLIISLWYFSKKIYNRLFINFENILPDSYIYFLYFQILLAILFNLFNILNYKFQNKIFTLIRLLILLFQMESISLIAIFGAIGIVSS